MKDPRILQAAHPEQQSTLKNSTQLRFGSEAEVSALTGISRRTLQKDRKSNRLRFPWYKSGRRILYDLHEVESVIRQTVRGVPE